MKAIALPEGALLAGAAAAGGMYVLLSGVPSFTIGRTLLATAAALALAALAARIRAGGTDAHRAFVPLLGGALAIALLGFGMEGSALRFDLSAPSTGFHLPGAGWVAGFMLLAAMGGTLLVTAHGVSSGASVLAPVLGYRALMLAGGLGIIASGLIAKAALAGTPTSSVGAWSAGVLSASLILLVGTQPWEAKTIDSAPLVQRALRLEKLGAVVVAVALLATGAEQWLARGAYLTDPTRMVLITALAGYAAVQETRLALTRTLLFAIVAVAALAAI